MVSASRLICAFTFSSRLSRDPLRKRHDAVLVADHDVARRNHQAADRNRHVDLARPALVGAAVNGRTRKERIGVGGDCRGVADGAVDHVAFGAAPLRDCFHDLADQRPAFVAAAVDHDDVARPHQLERLVDGEVVARPRLHGEGDAHQRGALVKGLEAHRARQALKIVADDRGRRVAERRDERGRGLRDAFHGDGDVIHSSSPLIAADGRPLSYTTLHFPASPIAHSSAARSHFARSAAAS